MRPVLVHTHQDGTLCGTCCQQRLFHTEGSKKVRLQEDRQPAYIRPGNEHLVRVIREADQQVVATDGGLETAGAADQRGSVRAGGPLW